MFCSVTSQSGVQEPEVQRVAYFTVNGEMQTEIIQMPDEYEDSLEDIVRERLAKGEDIRDIFEEIVEEKRMEIAQENLLKLLIILKDSKSPARTMDVLLVSCGLSALCSEDSDTALAKKHGITKQAFSVQVRNMTKELQVRRARHLKRDPSVYRRANSRNSTADCNN